MRALIAVVVDAMEVRQSKDKLLQRTPRGVRHGKHSQYGDGYHAHDEGVAMRGERCVLPRDMSHLATPPSLLMFSSSNRRKMQVFSAHAHPLQVELYALSWGLCIGPYVPTPPATPWAPLHGQIHSDP